MVPILSLNRLTAIRTMPGSRAAAKPAPGALFVKAASRAGMVMVLS
ncbi:MAG: hypothetical protein M5U09_12125 [Gammaproteobacteria bacterium]|nr:hypothetical protein [Gammaproteobacteria bacterium]